MTTTQTSSKRDTARSTVEGLAENPLALVAGGIAVGALVGALLPRAEKERELLAPVGRQLADRATSTVAAVKDAGKAEIESLLPNRDKTKDKVSTLFGTILDAAKSGAAPQKA